MLKLNPWALVPTPILRLMNVACANLKDKVTTELYPRPNLVGVKLNSTEMRDYWTWHMHRYDIDESLGYVPTSYPAFEAHSKIAFDIDHAAIDAECADYLAAAHEEALKESLADQVPEANPA